MKVTYYGQACTLVEVAGRRILTDPWLTEGAFGTWYHTHVLADCGVTQDTVARQRPDYLFLSHEHQDHVDADSLSVFPRAIPILICRFQNQRFRRHLERMGFTNISERPSGEALDLGDSLRITIFGSAEYTNDSALLIEGEGAVFFNETDCKLEFKDLATIAARNVDIGFFMFSGANWYPIMYDYPDEVMVRLVSRRRAQLLRGFVNRVKLVRPRFAVPSAGPCSVLDPELLWLNSRERGIFIDPQEAVAAVQNARLASEPLYMAATDMWSTETGHQSNSADLKRVDRSLYIAQASERMAPSLRNRYRQEPPAGSDLAERLVEYFNTRVAAQRNEIRQQIAARLALDVKGPQGGQWTVDFLSPGPTFVHEGLAPDWTYRVEVEDKLLYPFVAGHEEFLEDLFVSFRVRVARRPDEYNDRLYNFLYDPDPERLSRWYAVH